MNDNPVMANGPLAVFVTVTGCESLTVLCGCITNVRLEGLTCALALSAVIVTDGAFALMAASVAASADGAT